MIMDFTALAPLAGSLARADLPALATILGTVVPPPFDLLVGPAFALIKAAIGLPDTATPADVQAKVEADPVAAQTALKKIDDAHATAAAEVQAYLADVQDARATQIKLVDSGSKLQYVPAIWTAMVSIGFLGMLFLLIMHPIDLTANQVTVLNILFGVLTAEFARCGNFWLGTSQSAGKRTDQALTFAASSPPTSKRIGRA